MTIHETLITLRDSIYTVVGKLDTEVWVNAEPVPFKNRYRGEHKILSKGDKWGFLFDCGWFHFSGKFPPISNRAVPVLLIDVNGELLLVDGKGKALRGLTNKSSTFDKTLGEPVKRVFRLPTTVPAGDAFDYWADAGCNDLFGEIKENGTLKQADIALCNEDIRRNYYDFEFLVELLNGIPKENQQHKKIETVLDELTSILTEISETSLKKVSSILGNYFNRQPHHSDFQVSAIGHSHLDLAWLWPIRETRRKIGRTLSTVFELMERYPDYVYGISQPQLLVWVKEDYPDLYQRLKQKVNEGRIEVQGAMWVESDTNLPSGESLVRQIFYGKKFWEEEFGLDIDNLWLPDVFGFSGSLPQILKQTGVKYFSTLKLSWNTINKFPFHSFHWKGIDGSTVLTHMLPEETYNSPATPGSVLKIMDNYHEKDISNHALMVFGIGDGGGGPGAEHLERLDRMKNMTLPAEVKQEKISDFFSVWASRSKRFPTWEGELYLEKHQGTNTTEGLSKWYNRNMELNLRKMELISILAMTYAGRKYPAEMIENVWKEVLLYQFHDILPGSSIKRVYDESWKRYRTLLADTNKYIHKAEMDLIISEGFTPVKTDNNNEELSIMAFNFLSWEIAAWVSLNDKWTRVTIPSMGYAVHAVGQDDLFESDFKWNSSSMENKYIRIQFADDGSILSVFGKGKQYEFMASGQRGNVLTIYSDTGDAWDFPSDYRERETERFILMESTIRRNGPELINYQVYGYEKSILRQEVVLTADGQKIDFRTRVSWSVPEKMVRTSFPVNVPSGKAMCEIQFGAIERPVHSDTSWNLAKDEIAAQRWIDISNGKYGAALLNDSKYGHRVKDRILDLCLLRSVPYPGPEKGHTDMGEHSFTYSLFPHSGNYSEGGVVQAAHELNSPPVVFKIKQTGRNTCRSFFSTGDPSLIISTVKKAEKSEAIIIRLYESAGKCISTWLSADILQEKSISGNYRVEAARVNLLEEFQQKLSITHYRINLCVKPYEIITVKLACISCEE